MYMFMAIFFTVGVCESPVGGRGGGGSRGRSSLSFYLPGSQGWPPQASGSAFCDLPGWDSPKF